MVEFYISARSSENSEYREMVEFYSSARSSENSEYGEIPAEFVNLCSKSEDSGYVWLNLNVHSSPKEVHIDFDRFF